MENQNIILEIQKGNTSSIASRKQILHLAKISQKLLQRLYRNITENSANWIPNSRINEMERRNNGFYKLNEKHIHGIIIFGIG
jgi:hypothetical protein